MWFLLSTQVVLSVQALVGKGAQGWLMRVCICCLDEPSHRHEPVKRSVQVAIINSILSLSQLNQSRSIESMMKAHVPSNSFNFCGVISRFMVKTRLENFIADLSLIILFVLCFSFGNVSPVRRLLSSSFCGALS